MNPQILPGKRKSKFDEDLASRINKEVKKKIVAPDKQIVAPTSDDLVHFGDTRLNRKEYEALVEVYSMLGKKPEDDYKLVNTGYLRIKKGYHLYYVHLDCRNLSRCLSKLPESVGCWKNLELIHLSHNQLTSLPEAVGNWINLKGIWLHHNNLSSLPESVSNWTKLERIDLFRNPIARDEAYLTELQKKLPKAKIYT